MSKPRISYVDPSTIDDPAMLAEFERCAREGTPRPESQAIRAHVPAVFWSFAGTARGPFFGIAGAGTRVAMNGAALYVFEAGSIKSVRHIFDFSGVLLKTGVLKVKPS